MSEENGNDDFIIIVRKDEDGNDVEFKVW